MNAAARRLPVDDAPLLEAERLALQVGERWLCCEFTLSLAAGECLVLLGPNGAGKTTLLHTLAGGTLLTLADTAARTVMAPQQLPVGVLTALIGVPVFLFLLSRSPRATS